MSYCIEYNPELKRKYPKLKVKRQLPTKKLLFLLAFCVAAYVFMASEAYRYLLPGNPDVTIAAFSTMVERVEDGDPMNEAVRSFCEEIITNGIK